MEQELSNSCEQCDNIKRLAADMERELNDIQCDIQFMKSKGLTGYKLILEGEANAFIHIIRRLRWVMGMKTKHL